MTAEQFLKKYPNPGYNDNCLRDIACPVCGYRDRFRVAATSFFTMTDNGEDDHSDIEYNKSSFATCELCGHGGSMAEFTVAGLDDLLEAM